MLLLLLKYPAMASSTETNVIPASATLPLVYRLSLTTIEPLFAVNGALLVFRNPGTYLSMMTRDVVLFTAPSTFLYTTTGGAWLYFAFVEAVVMRLFDDLRLWRVLCAGMLLSDAAYCHAIAQAVGGWAVYMDVLSWTRDDHAVFWATAPLVLVRILVVLGVGVKTGSNARKVKA